MRGRPRRSMRSSGWPGRAWPTCAPRWSATARSASPSSAGVLGFVVKDAPTEDLAAAIRRVAAGERVVDPTLAAATLAGGASPLTGRERDVLVAARDGATVADIAARLFLSEGTVRNYLSAAITKTGTRNRGEALRVAET